MESAHNALNDPEILDHSMEFATDVVGDDIVQQTSGEALRNTVTYAVGPGVSACKYYFIVHLGKYSEPPHFGLTPVASLDSSYSSRC